MIYVNNKEGYASARALLLANRLRYCVNSFREIPGTIEKLAEFLKVHRNTVGKEVKELVSLGVLVKQAKPGSDGKQQVHFALITSSLRGIECCHGKLIENLVCDAYATISLENRGQRLGPLNYLLLSLLLAHSNEAGEINDLSQTDIRTLLSFTQAQLKYQMNKLESLGLLTTLMKGGTQKGLIGRHKSKLKLNIQMIQEVVLGSASHIQNSEVRLAPLLTSAKTTKLTVENLRHVTDLFETGIYADPPFPRLTSIKPVKDYPHVAALFFPSNKGDRLRHYYDLVNFCPSLALTGLKQMTEDLGPSAGLNEIISSVNDVTSIIRQRLESLFSAQLLEDLQVRYGAEQLGPKYHSLKRKVDNLSKLHSLQIRAIERVLRAITLSLVAEPNLISAYKDHQQLGPQIQLNIIDLDGGEYSLSSKNLRQT